MDLSTCSFVVPSFARESAASWSGMLQREGIHCRVIAWLLQREARAADRSLWSVSLFDWRVCRTDKAADRSLWLVSLLDWRVCRTDKASVRRTTLGEA